mmetsp:Transcript_3174/g.6591  ORF Transcript_3174/g.6591 Transcript_3174/m.6591 type:complete len:84 (-) Transcript_3174:450-701(-)
MAAAPSRKMLEGGRPPRLDRDCDAFRGTGKSGGVLERNELRDQSFGNLSPFRDSECNACGSRGRGRRERGQGRSPLLFLNNRL